VACLGLLLLALWLNPNDRSSWSDNLDLAFDLLIYLCVGLQLWYFFNVDALPSKTVLAREEYIKFHDGKNLDNYFDYNKIKEYLKMNLGTIQ
jgi:hypothetical protein